MIYILGLESRVTTVRWCFIQFYYDHLDSVTKTSYSRSYFTPIGYLVPEYLTCSKSYQPSQTHIIALLHLIELCAK